MRPPSGARSPAKAPSSATLRRQNDALRARLAAAEDALRSSLAERRRFGQAARRLARAHLSLSQCNEVLVRATNEQELLQNVCRTIVETAGYRMAWVGLADQDDRKQVRPVAHAGMDAGYLRRITVTWGDDAHGRGPTGRCIRERKPVVAQNLLTEPDFEPWRAEARRRGYASSAALPLLADGHVLGALAIYAREPDAFDPLELRLLGELADDLAFGISTLRGRLERQALQAQLVVADRLSSMGALAAGVAHEINNPLAYVVSSLEVMEGALATARRTLRRAPAEAERAVDQALELVASAQEGAERVRTIVRDLKGFSRSDEESTGPTDVGRVVELAMSLASNETKHRARLVKKLGLLPPARCNEGRLGQVLLNLLVNAAHAIAPGHPEGNEIRVTGRKKGNRVLLEVRDTGSGIAPEHLGRIFDPFFTTKPLGQGTGLGLSICHTIVSSMGGEITVASKIGKGTVFTLAVPAGEAAPRPRAGDRAPRSARTR